jgi:hypothetical protein
LIKKFTPLLGDNITKGCADLSNSNYHEQQTNNRCKFSIVHSNLRIKPSQQELVLEQPKYLPLNMERNGMECGMVEEFPFHSILWVFYNVTD